MKLEVFLARRYLASQKGRGLSVISWIALLGVMIGVMSLITVRSVMSGFEKELREKILGNNAHIFVQLSQDTKPDLDAILKRVRETPGVTAAMPVIYGQGFLMNRVGAEGVSIKGVDPTLVRDVLALGSLVEFKKWNEFEKGQLILGNRLARSLGVQVGDSVSLVMNRGEVSPLGLVPKMRKLVVADFFHSGMSQFDASHAFLPLDTARRLFDQEPSIIEVKTVDVRRIDEVAVALRERVPEAYQVVDWISENKEFLSALQLEKLVMSVILGLIVLVAAFNICGSLIMVVRDKTKDIAILKSMGAFDITILRLFLLQGTFLGLVGTVAGVILGVVLSWALKDVIQFPLDASVYMIDRLPVDLRASDVGLVAVGAVIMSALATFYPAKLAANLIPTEGLKSE